MSYKRNYRKEYDNYHGRPEQIKRRDSRNAARNLMKKRGVNVAGKDVTHRNGNPRDNKFSNLGISSVKRNRSFARTKTAGKVRSRA
tara:strand:- start:123 stop:380 length:258 start_codon:yes stop_codon:yes gene_type:complete